MPRSLSFCFSHIHRTLEMLADMYGTENACHQACAEALSMLEGNNMDNIFSHGLHEFLTEFTVRNNRVSETLGESYNFY
jgi:uncharacterized alpha-E superfamily protein